MQYKYNINFTKAVGSGNDFIIIDNKDGSLDGHGFNYSEMAQDLCRRHTSIGADGILVLEGSSKADFKMRIINPDGSEVDMCGNGARCSALYAAQEGWGDKLDFLTGAGILSSEVDGNLVKIKMSDPKDIDLDLTLGIGRTVINACFINTGVPHVVHGVEDIDNYPVKDIGRKVREHSSFAPDGTNVNFIGINNGVTKIRTYERGVEDETMACGTGTVASALVMGLVDNVPSPVKLETKSGETLTVYFKLDGKKVRDVFLEGLANIIFKGRV